MHESRSQLVDKSRLLSKPVNGGARGGLLSYNQSVHTQKSNQPLLTQAIFTTVLSGAIELTSTLVETLLDSSSPRTNFFQLHSKSNSALRALFSPLTLSSSKTRNNTYHSKPVAKPQIFDSKATTLIREEKLPEIAATLPAMAKVDDFNDRQTQIDAENAPYHQYEYQTEENESWAGALPVKQ